MIVGSRTLHHLSKRTPNPTLLSRVASASYASASATSDEYHSLNDQLFHEMQNPVSFQGGDKAAIFDSTECQERRFVPFEIKEVSFKCGMGIAGTMFWEYMYCTGLFGEVVAASFALNWVYRTVSIMSATVRKVELHKDGRTVTVTPRIGSAFDCKISDVQKLKHEKELVQTFEESYLFPVQIAGKKWYLHGQGQESIKHGEAFRAVINGQSIKL